MQIKLYKYDGNPLQINKKFESKGTISGHFKDNTSLKSPTFIIKNRNTVNYNYLSIDYDNYTYYYQINDITMVEDTQELTCEIDILRTFKDYILTIKGTIERASYKNVENYKLNSESLFNNFIDDTEVLTTSVPLRSCFPSGGTEPIFTSASYNNIYLTTTN